MLKEKDFKNNFGNVFMPGNARAMYLGTMEECVSSFWTKNRSRIYTGFEDILNRQISRSLLGIFSQLCRSGEGLLTAMCACKNRI